jgi:sarcosine oxidase / L-pipecolate oxidase
VEVPDGSSNDISRVIRIDYGDSDYADLAHEALKSWKAEPKYRGIFQTANYILAGFGSSHGRAWVDKARAALKANGLDQPLTRDTQEIKNKYPMIHGHLGGPEFYGYDNDRAGWVDASKAIALLRNECLDLGISFLVGHAGTVIGLDKDSSSRRIDSVQTLSGTTIKGDVFVVAAGAWTSGLINMYGSTLANAQVIGYLRLSEEEVERYADLPILQQITTGWFNLPPHKETRFLKMAIHGWGYTRTPGKGELNSNTSSSPRAWPVHRANFVPAEAQKVLRDGLIDMLPELRDRPFEQVALCWYTDTPTGDFIMDFHPDFENVFVANGGSGQ